MYCFEVQNEVFIIELSKESGHHFVDDLEIDDLVTTLKLKYCSYLTDAIKFRNRRNNHKCLD